MNVRNLVLALSLAALPTLSLATATTKPEKEAAPAAQPAPAAASTGAAGAQNAQILAEKARVDKKAMVAGAMALTDAESQAFWPLYDEYQKGLEDLNARHVKAITDFVDAQKKGTPMDDAARKLTDDQLAVEQAEVDLRKTMAPKLAKALPPLKVARYLQIENKVRTMVRAQLAQRLPIVGGPAPRAAGAKGPQGPRQAPAKKP